ncbi:MAG: TonB-dependent receptor plug domain-containing protein [Gammaproteobacteria bacterium]
MRYSTSLSSAVALLACTFSHAQNTSDDNGFEPLVVTGSRLDQNQSDIGTSVTILTAEDLQQQGFDFVVDALASVPGLTVNTNGAFGGTTSVRIRGAAGEQTLVLIDGVAVNDPTAPGGGFDFARLDTANIERIEVLKGSQSTLWGSDAIGGLIAITTKRADPEMGGEATLQFGSFGTTRASASVDNATDVGEFRIAAVATEASGLSKADENNGNPEDDGFESLTLSASGGLNLPRGMRLSASVLVSDADTDFDSFAFGAQGSVGDGDETNETEETVANLALDIPLLDGRFTNTVFVGYREIERANFTAGVPGFSSEGDRTVFRYQGNVEINESNSLAFGAEREDASANDDETSIDGLFALYAFRPTDTVTLTGGLRSDDHERFGQETTARLAAAWNPSPQTTVRASWGQGFKAPTIFQSTFFCCGATQANVNLQPETAETFDIGVVWRSEDGLADVDVTYFNADTENQIDFSFAIGGYENIARVKSSGVELAASYALLDWLTATASYAYVDAEDGNGTRLSRLPRHSGDMALSANPLGGFSGTLLLRVNGEERNTDGTVLDGWSRVDVAARYSLNERFELFGRIENLFDAEYQQVLGYGTPGLSGFAGLRLRY